MSRQSSAIRDYFEQNGIKNKYIGERLGISPAAVCNMLAGRDSIGFKRATQLSEIFGFDTTFLLTGEGSLFPAKPVQAVNIGAVVEGNKAGRDINVTTANAALQAENERLRNEVEWLRSQLSKNTEN